MGINILGPSTFQLFSSQTSHLDSAFKTLIDFPLTRLVAWSVGRCTYLRLAKWRPLRPSEPLFHFKAGLNLVPATRFLKALFQAVSESLRDLLQGRAKEFLHV